MNRIRLYDVVGIDDLEGTVFAMCTTLEKAKVAKKKLENAGLEGSLDILQSEIPVDAIELDGKLVEL